MKYLTALAAVIALLVITATGCGGGSDDSTSPAGGGDSSNASASGDSASAAANEACAAANQKIAALSNPDNDHAVVEYMEETEEVVEQLRVEVTGLDGSPEIAEYAKALASSVPVLNEMANAARSGNPDGVRELSKQLERLHVGKVAAAAGLDTCAEAPGAGS